MTLKRIFIDGEAGTTGLQIAERLADRHDIELIQIDAALRKDPAARREALNHADVAILCLPDEAAREAVGWVTNSTTRIIDASSAHRSSDGWVYGFPEYDVGQRGRIEVASRISNPGCYAIAAVSILNPLIAAGLLPSDWPVSINGVSGYSGGGKALIAAFEDPDNPNATASTTYDYALTLKHKHIPEMTRWSGLDYAPIFLPSVGRYYKGMLVRVPLPLWALPGTVTSSDCYDVYRSHYHGERFVTLADHELADPAGQLDPEALNDSNELRLHVLHDESDDQAVIVGQLDNLGKGASGQVVQTLNILLSADEATGL